MVTTNYPFLKILFIVLKGQILKEKYRIVDFIRGGGFGDVFLAKHVVKNYDVAVKIVSVQKIAYFDDF